jgi:hypothetical protein
MPERVWSYSCCATTATSLHCPTCGGPGEFAGWGLTVPEAMERYRRAYGLEPIGSHLDLAKECFEGLRSDCGRCGGTGLEGDVYEWRYCLRCEGGGGVWTASEDAIRAAWRRVLQSYPAAAVDYGESPWAGVPPDAPAPAWTPEAQEAFAAYQRKVHQRQDGHAPDEGAPVTYRPVSFPPPVKLKEDSKLRRLEALRRRRRAARRRPKGYSIHGLRHTDVQQAFVEAERRLGVHWPLKGRGHCRRATLAPSYARTVARVARSGEVMNPEFSRGWLQLYPLPIIEEAARILGVTPWILVGQEY